jgi:nucleoside-diphosphate-sugar epimerase
MRILVTGGAGYIGSVLVPTLLAAGHEVTVLDSFIFAQSSLLECCASPAFRVIRGDARDEATLAGALRDQQVVVALAALVGAPLCDRDPIGATTTNLEAIRLLASLRSPDQLILYPNSNSGYGIGDAGKHCTEDSPLRPISHYGRTKVEAERVVLESGNAISFRLATVFGTSPRMRLDLLVNDFVYRAVSDSSVVVFQGHFKRNYIHIRDVARVFVHAMENAPAMRDRVYNVGLDDANLSKIELCERIRRQVPRFEYFEAPIGEDPDKRDYIVSNARIADTGFRTAYSLDDGIAELIKGYTILRRNAFANV